MRVYPLIHEPLHISTAIIHQTSIPTSTATEINLYLTTCSCADFYQRVSIASYASAGIARGGLSVCLSVRLCVTLRYCIKTKKASVMISSPSDRLNILFSSNIRFITKFDRGHP